MSNEIIIELNRKQFKQLLEVNPGYIIIKFTAEWCNPCKRNSKRVFRLTNNRL